MLERPPAAPPSRRRTALALSLALSLAMGAASLTLAAPASAAPPERTIAEIQGTGATSPLVGEDVVTRGVVTATYPTGGLRGFVLQTAGSGADLDLSTPAPPTRCSSTSVASRPIPASGTRSPCRAP
jgi:5'-nucleotidase